ncbi:hypothetical protein QS468_20560 [Bacillus subtilis]|nr:hypothetical protein [Pseudomonas sp. A29(2023)]MDL5595120.1 hypothetical protein [Bacillus subtilis]
MSDRHNKQSISGIGCALVVMLTLTTSTSVRAEGCVGIGCLVNGGPLEFSMLTGIGLFLTVAGPFISTSEASANKSSKHYTQALIDDAATHMATEGEYESPILESEWHKYLKSYGHQPSKNEFARMVLATYG